MDKTKSVVRSLLDIPVGEPETAVPPYFAGYGAGRLVCSV